MEKNTLMRYYRSKSFLGKIAVHMEMSNTEAHECMKESFFRKSTTEFSEEEFEEKLKDIRKYFAGAGVWIPEPGEEDAPPKDTTDYSKEGTNII